MDTWIQAQYGCHSCLVKAQCICIFQLSPSLCRFSWLYLSSLSSADQVLSWIAEPSATMLAGGPSVSHDQASTVVFIRVCSLSSVVQFFPSLLHFLLWFLCHLWQAACTVLFLLLWMALALHYIGVRKVLWEFEDHEFKCRDNITDPYILLFLQTFFIFLLINVLIEYVE